MCTSCDCSLFSVCQPAGILVGEQSVISKSPHCYFVTLRASNVLDPCRMWLEVMKGIHSTSLLTRFCQAMSTLGPIREFFFSRSQAIFFERSVRLVKCDPDLLNHYHFRVVQTQHSTKAHAGLKPVLCSAAAL